MLGFGSSNKNFNINANKRDNNKTIVTVQKYFTQKIYKISA